MLFEKISVTNMGKCDFQAKLTFKVERHSEQYYTNTPHGYSSLRRKCCCVSPCYALERCRSWTHGVFAVPVC